MNLLALDKKIGEHIRRGYKPGIKALEKHHPFNTTDSFLDYKIECVNGNLKNRQRPCGKCHGKRVKPRVGPMWGEVK
jgi:predicted PP-loop superfamily ATPase